MSKQNKITRRNFIKIGAGLLGAAASSRLFRNSFERSGEIALAASNAQAIPPDLHLAATDGWINLPGQVPIPGTIDQYFNPDTWAPEGLTTYMFGFRNVTGLTPGQILEQKMKCQASAPMFWVNEGQEYRLRLSNLGLAMRPDLTDTHTVHWHGFRNAYPVFDGEPHSGMAVPVGKSMTFYYRPGYPGTYMYHCHVEETEHVSMGMTGAVFVTAAQNGTALVNANDGRSYTRFAYSDGDGTTGYDREFAVCLTDVWSESHWDDAHIQLPDWTDYKPEYFLMNGRVYPDTLIGNGNSEDDPWRNDPSTGDLIAPPDPLDPINNPRVERLKYQPISSLMEGNGGETILLRFLNLSFIQMAMTIPGLKMQVVGRDATHLRNGTTDLYYEVNTLYNGVGESYDVLVRLPEVTQPTTYLLHSRNLYQLANAGAAGFGGPMTEIRVYPQGSSPLDQQVKPNTNPHIV